MTVNLVQGIALNRQSGAFGGRSVHGMFDLVRFLLVELLAGGCVVCARWGVRLVYNVGR